MSRTGTPDQPAIEADPRIPFPFTDHPRQRRALRVGVQGDRRRHCTRAARDTHRRRMARPRGRRRPVRMPRLRQAQPVHTRRYRARSRGLGHLPPLPGLRPPVARRPRLSPTPGARPHLADHPGRLLLRLPLPAGLPLHRRLHDRHRPRHPPTANRCAQAAAASTPRRSGSSSPPSPTAPAARPTPTTNSATAGCTPRPCAASCPPRPPRHGPGA